MLVSLIVSLAASCYVAGRLGQPVLLGMAVGGVLGLISSFMVGDVPVAQMAAGVGWHVVPYAAGLGLGLFLGADRPLVMAGVVPVIFLQFYLDRFGVYGHLFGVMLFASYLIGLTQPPDWAPIRISSLSARPARVPASSAKRCCAGITRPAIYARHAVHTWLRPGAPGPASRSSSSPAARRAAAGVWIVRSATSTPSGLPSTGGWPALSSTAGSPSTCTARPSTTSTRSSLSRQPAAASPRSTTSPTTHRYPAR
jgi:hypothetical protein